MSITGTQGGLGGSVVGSVGGPIVPDSPGPTRLLYGTLRQQKLESGAPSEETKDTQELIESYPKIRYDRPDVTDTSGICLRPKDWQDTSFSFGLISRTPDLACPAVKSAVMSGSSGDISTKSGDSGGFKHHKTSPSHTTTQPLCLVGERSSVEARLSDALGRTTCRDRSWPSRRLSRSLEDLPRDIQDHIRRCQCSCGHMGYGHVSRKAVARLTNGCPGLLTPSISIPSDLPNTPEHQGHTHTHTKTQGAEGGLGGRTRIWVCLVLMLGAAAGVGVGVPLALRVDPGAAFHTRLETAKTLLSDIPLIDGHNDLPWNIRKFMHNKLHSFNFTAELKKLRPWSRSSWSHTDLPRLRQGMVGAQFWVSYVPCASQTLNAVQLTIEQIDLIKRLIEQYPDDLRLATNADEVEAAFKEGRIASLIGVEGGHAIQNSLGVLRALRDLGVRYLTLTHTCSTPWAECARAKESDIEDPNAPRGLTFFGKTVVREMNRLGLLVDLSHVSQATMRAAIRVSRAPVIFSHSSVYAICKNPRNIPDDVLKNLTTNGGMVMVSFYNYFLTCSEVGTISDVIEHINHVRKVAGIDHVGIGADFDGINKVPTGLEDVSTYPTLFAELLADPTWTLADLRKLAGENLLRVMRQAEQVRLELQRQNVKPYEEEVEDDTDPTQPCFYRFTRDAE